nr:hypothetical protein [Stenotrophomonas maltophilia]
MEDLLTRSALLRQAILSTVDYPLADDSPRLLASLDAALLSLEHADSLRTLLQAGMASSAMALMRCQYEAFTRSVWILHCAADEQVELLSLPPEAGMSEKGLPMLSKMLEAFAEVSELGNLLPHLVELKVHAWSPLNSFRARRGARNEPESRRLPRAIGGQCHPDEQQPFDDGGAAPRHPYRRPGSAEGSAAAR